MKETELRLVNDGGWDIRYNARRIILRCDGNGPMGLYDVIHVFDHAGKEIRTIPAHQASDWEVS